MEDDNPYYNAIYLKKETSKKTKCNPFIAQYTNIEIYYGNTLLAI